MSSSVQHPRFGSGPPFTLGVEEEYMLLDADSYDLVQHIDSVLAATEGHELGSRVAAELMQSVLEIATPVCRTAGEVHTELRKLEKCGDEAIHIFPIPQNRLEGRG